MVENLGLQIDIKYVVGNKSTFIPNDIVKDIFVNEVISRVNFVKKSSENKRITFLFSIE